MSRAKRKKGVSALVSIRTQSLVSRTPTAGSNVIVQLVIQLAFMMLYTFAFTGILLTALDLAFNIPLSMLTILFTYVTCFLFVRFKQAGPIVLSVAAIVLLVVWIFPNGLPGRLFIEPFDDLVNQVRAWVYALGGATSANNHGYPAVAQLIVLISSLVSFTWSGLSTAPFAMGLLASFAYGVSEYLAKEDTVTLLKILYFLAMLASLRFLAQRKDARSDEGTLRTMSRGRQTLKTGETVRRNWAIIAACFVMAFVVFFDIALPNKLFYNHGLDQSISKMVGRRYGKGRQPVSLIEFSLRALGYQPLENRLGGSALPDPNAYLTIETDGRPVWLKGASSIRYTGQGWITETMNPNWMFNHVTASESQNLIIGFAHKSETPTMNQAARSTKLTLYPHKPQQVVFHGGRPVAFTRVGSRAAFNAYFNRSGTLYLDELIPEEGYTVSGQVILPLLVETESMLRAFQAEYASTTGGELLLSRDDRMSYTELPVLPNLENDVRQFDEALHRLVFVRTNAYSDLDVIEGIRHTLSTKLAYSLEADIPEENEEFVGWFLREGKGYCSFFATATTVLARSAGIPARYVEGFLVPATAPGHETKQTLTGKLGHAWCEVWVDQAGWVPIDSTPKGRLDAMARTDYMYGIAPPSETVPTEPKPTDPPEPSMDKPQPPEPTQTVPEPPVIDESIRLLRLILYLSPLWGYLVWREIVYRRRHSDSRYGRMKERLGHARFVQYIAEDIFTMWKLEGRAREPYESPRTYIRRVERARYDIFPQELTMYVEQSLYAPVDSVSMRDDKQMKNLLDFYRQEEVYLRNSVGFRTWFMRRWLTSFRERF
ncbi:MAG TPA: transglutaminase domain-containing protein [Clostridia bacterium]|nr:transglutaminase domain-containing protein [Clostridia bacterium]